MYLYLCPAQKALIKALYFCKTHLFEDKISIILCGRKLFTTAKLNSIVSQYPISAQILSQFLTLQVSIAHTDMNELSGSTMILPFSHQYNQGYLAW